MSVKILGGPLKGMPLKVLDVNSLRPTSVMLRRKFFDSFQDWEGINFCDLFAGSGAMGFEALSRGSKKILLNEKNKRVAEQLRFSKDEVLQKTGFQSEQIKLSCIDGVRYLKNLLQEIESDDKSAETWCFFIDPPYDHQGVYEQLFRQFQKLEDSENKGNFFIVLESEKGRGMNLAAWQSKYPDGKCIWNGDHYFFMTWL